MEWSGAWALQPDHAALGKLLSRCASVSPLWDGRRAGHTAARMCGPSVCGHPSVAICPFPPRGAQGGDEASAWSQAACTVSFKLPQAAVAAAQGRAPGCRRGSGLSTVTQWGSRARPRAPGPSGLL